ncbi:MAG TPA: hypothetical protein ENL08_02090 [Bacteroidetes bacterium]|nr:hypothetical protein [Bacteroidota bacterium]
MKKRTVLSIISLVAITMLSGTGHAATGRLTEPAREMIAQAAPDEMLPVVVLMKERPDVPAMREMVRGLPREQRKRLVWETVRDLAERTQYDLLDLLGADKRSGLVEEYTSIRIINGISLKATAEVIERVAQRDDVGRIIADPLQPIFNPIESDREEELDEIVWSVQMIHAPEVWDMGYTGQGVLVAIIDSGVNYNHVDLADHLWDGGEEFPNHGWDFGNNDNDPLDDDGHGTHVAGSICGDGTGGTQTGVAPDATLMICKVSLGIGQGDQATVWEAHDFVLEHGADVTSMSMGYLDSWSPDRTTWRGTYEVLDAAGIVNVVAAGNERGWYQPPISCRTPGNVPSPWRHPDEVEEGGRGGVISVGATTDQDVYASFSSNGPCEWEDVDPYYDYPYGDGHVGLIRPDIAAPGEDIYSTSINGGYTYMSGTSMATPHIAGVVCLILSKTPELLPVQVDSVMQITALDLGPDGKDNDYGAGRVQADLAVEAANPPFGYLQGTVTD